MSVIRIHLSFLNTLVLLRLKIPSSNHTSWMQNEIHSIPHQPASKSGGFQRASWVHVSSMKLRITSVVLHVFRWICLSMYIYKSFVSESFNTPILIYSDQENTVCSNFDVCVIGILYSCRWRDGWSVSNSVKRFPLTPGDFELYPDPASALI